MSLANKYAMLPVSTQMTLCKNIVRLILNIVRVYNLVTGKYRYVNKSNSSLFGYTASGFLKQGIPFTLSSDNQVYCLNKTKTYYEKQILFFTNQIISQL